MREAGSSLPAAARHGRRGQGLTLPERHTLRGVPCHASWQGTAQRRASFLRGRAAAPERGQLVPRLRGRPGGLRGAARPFTSPRVRTRSVRMRVCWRRSVGRIVRVAKGNAYCVCGPRALSRPGHALRPPGGARVAPLRAGWGRCRPGAHGKPQVCKSAPFVPSGPAGFHNRDRWRRGRGGLPGRQVNTCYFSPAFLSQRLASALVRWGCGVGGK